MVLNIAIDKLMFKLCFAGDRFNVHSQLEHLQSKYIGTGKV
jgi:hypothetical protein